MLTLALHFLCSLPLQHKPSSVNDGVQRTVNLKREESRSTTLLWTVLSVCFHFRLYVYLFVFVLVLAPEV
jgi:hypothetical protein